MKFLVIFLSAVAIVGSIPVAQEDSVFRLVASNFVNCINSDINVCLKEQALKAAERLGTVRKLNIIEGVTLYNNGPKEARSLEALSADPEARNKQLSERLWDSTSDLLQKSELEFSFAGGEEEEDDDESRSLNDAEESRGKKKKQLKKKLKFLIPLAILAKAKAVALVVIALLVIAASVFKLALLAKIAFIAKVIAIVKALIAKKHTPEEHGWAAHEEHGHQQAGWEGGWSRSRNEANSLAYSGYQQ